MEPEPAKALVETVCNWLNDGNMLPPSSAEFEFATPFGELFDGRKYSGGYIRVGDFLLTVECAKPITDILDNQKREHQNNIVAELANRANEPVGSNTWNDIASNSNLGETLPVTNWPTIIFKWTNKGDTLCK